MERGDWSACGFGHGAEATLGQTGPSWRGGAAGHGPRLLEASTGVIRLEPDLTPAARPRHACADCWLRSCELAGLLPQEHPLRPTWSGASPRHEGRKNIHEARAGGDDSTTARPPASCGAKLAAMPRLAHQAVLATRTEYGMRPGRGPLPTDAVSAQATVSAKAMVRSAHAHGAGQGHEVGAVNGVDAGCAQYGVDPSHGVAPRARGSTRVMVRRAILQACATHGIRERLAPRGATENQSTLRRCCLELLVWGGSGSPQNDHPRSGRDARPGVPSTCSAPSTKPPRGSAGAADSVGGAAHEVAEAAHGNSRPNGFMEPPRPLSSRLRVLRAPRPPRPADPVWRWRLEEQRGCAVENIVEPQRTAACYATLMAARPAAGHGFRRPQPVGVAQYPAQTAGPAQGMESAQDICQRTEVVGAAMSTARCVPRPADVCTIHAACHSAGVWRCCSIAPTWRRTRCPGTRVSPVLLVLRPT